MVFNYGLGTWDLDFGLLTNISFQQEFCINHKEIGFIVYCSGQGKKETGMEKIKCFTIFLLFSHIQSSALKKPNIIIFLVDDLGYGDLGYTGHPTNR